MRKRNSEQRQKIEFNELKFIEHHHGRKALHTSVSMKYFIAPLNKYMHELIVSVGDRERSRAKLNKIGNPLLRTTQIPPREQRIAG